MPRTLQMPRIHPTRTPPHETIVGAAGAGLRGIAHPGQGQLSLQIEERR